MENAHYLLLENKNYLKINCVQGINNLTENEVSVLIGGEILEVKGSNIKAEKLSVETGELILTGNIFSIKYEVVKEKKGLFKRIFK